MVDRKTLRIPLPAPTVGSLAQALAAARDACAATAAARHVGLAIDGDRLTLVLVNLIDNAVSHRRVGGGVFVPRA